MNSKIPIIILFLIFFQTNVKGDCCSKSCCNSVTVCRLVLGRKGATGSPGAQGPQGITGSTGPCCTSGVTGTTGTANNSTGIQGTTGTTGAQGMQGTAGATGAQGSPGGPPGTPGSTGITGITGPATGATGTPGTPGTTGTTGAQGTTGTTGNTGTTGLQGNTGTSGTTGTLGTAGIIGTVGIPGTPGTPGTAGSLGSAGTAGSVGSQGVSGTTGGGALLGYGYIYNLTPAPPTIAVGAPILFSDNGPLLGITHVLGSSDIVISNPGVYSVTFSVSGSEPNQFAIFLDSVLIPVVGTTYGSGAGTQQNTGPTIITTVIPNSVLTIVNNRSPAAVTLASFIGGTQANVNASVLIKRLS